MRRLLLIVVLLAVLTAVVSAPVAADGTIEHIVDRGETLASIARHYHTTIQAILAVNPSIWNPNYVWAGTRLQIPTGNTPQPPQPPLPPAPNPCTYVVRHGDTLIDIAHWFGVSPWDIASLNGIYNLNRIYSGMYLNIPCATHLPSLPSQPTYPTYPTYPDPVEYPCQYNCEPLPPYLNTVQYTVQPGDSLTRIAGLYGTTVEAILELNQDTIPWGNYIQRGQVIIVPVGPDYAN